MKLKLIRHHLGKDYTIGKLFIDGGYFCDTLEDTHREKKIKNETCIPFGEYKIIINRSPRFKRDLPRLLDVPNFEGILIHRGNTSKDTSGCILVGQNRSKGMVFDSAEHEIKLVELMKLAIAREESITIEITH